MSLGGEIGHRLRNSLEITTAFNPTVPYNNATDLLGTFTGGINVTSVGVGYQLAGLPLIYRSTVDPTSLAFGKSSFLTIQVQTPPTPPLYLYNLAIGDYVMPKITTGGSNVGVGYSVLSACTTGFWNTIMGTFAGTNITTGDYNTVIGYDALGGCTTGNGNTAIGTQAIFGNSLGALTGQFNTAVGHFTGYHLNSTANSNTFIGHAAGYLVTTGATNTIIGDSVGSGVITTGTNNILIGTSSAVDTIASNSTYQLNIGALIRGDMTYSTSGFNTSFYVQSVSSGINYITAKAGAHTVAASLAATGGDTNVDMQLLSAGTGYIRLLTNSVETMTIGSNKCVGINNTNPLYGLDLIGQHNAIGMKYLQAISSPTQPTVTNGGTAGTTTYGYVVVAKIGGNAVASIAGYTTTGNATLSATNYNTITWTAVPGALTYDVYRTVGGSAQGIISSSQSGVTLNDTGLTATVQSVPKSNGTGQLSINSLSPNYNLDMKGESNIYGNMYVQQLGTPSAPTVTTQGTAGTTTWSYKIVANVGSTVTAASTAGSVTTGNATLTIANNNKIVFSPVAGATYYTIYRTAAGTSPATLGVIGTIPGNGSTGNMTFIDTGLAGDTTSPPTVNTTGAIGITTVSPGALLSFGNPGFTSVGNANVLRIYDSGTNSYGIGFNANTGELASTAGTSGFLSFYTANTSRMTIASGGTVFVTNQLGVGNSSIPNSDNLYIGNGGSSTNAVVSIDGGNTSGQGSGFRFRGGGTSRFYFGMDSWVNGGTNYNDFTIQSVSGALRFEANSHGTPDIYVDTTGAVYFENISTTASAANAFINSASSPVNSILRSTSSMVYKTNIRTVEIDTATKVLLGLRPVKYQSKAKADNPDWSWYGFIAEEVAAIDPRLVHWGYREEHYDWVPEPDNIKGKLMKVLKKDAKMVPDGVMYDRLVVHLVAKIQEYEARIKALESK